MRYERLPAACALMISAHHRPAPGFKFLIETCNYYPLLTVYAIWALGVYAHWTMHSDPAMGQASPAGRSNSRTPRAARPHRESSAPDESSEAQRTRNVAIIRHRCSPSGLDRIDVVAARGNDAVSYFG